MADDIRQLAARASDEELVRMLFRQREQFTEGALRVLQEELDKRGLAPEQIERLKGIPVVQQRQYSREEFAPLDHSFSQTDILLVSAMFREESIPFLVDSPESSDIMPTEGIAARVFKIHVHRDHLERARAMLEGLYTGVGGVYTMKDLSPRERLKTLSFYDIGLDVSKETGASLQVQFTAAERGAIADLAQRLLGQIDEIERTMDRTVFYFDSLESVLARLRSGDAQSWGVADLLAILEVLQVYCDDPGFPPDLETTIVGLLEFVKSLSGT